MWGGFPGGLNGKESSCNAGDLGSISMNTPWISSTQGSIPGLGRSLGGGHGNPLHYSYLENPHGLRSLVGYSPWGLKESETTEWLILEWVAISFSKGSSQPGIKPESLVSPALQADSLPTEPLGKPHLLWVHLHTRSRQSSGPPSTADSCKVMSVHINETISSCHLFDGKNICSWYSLLLASIFLMSKWRLRGS